VIGDVSHWLSVEEETMKGIIAWLLGVPIFVIFLLYIFNVF